MELLTHNVERYDTMPFYGRPPSRYRALKFVGPPWFCCAIISAIVVWFGVTLAVWPPHNLLRTLSSIWPAPFRASISCEKATLAAPLLPVPLAIPETIRTYVQWHAETLAHTAFDDGKCANDVQILIWRCSPNHECAGLGDRFSGMVFTFYLAILTRRLFFIDLAATRGNLYFSVDRAVMPAVINWTLPECLMTQKAEFFEWRKRWPFLAPLKDGNFFDLERDAVGDLFQKHRIVSVSSTSAIGALYGLQANLNSTVQRDLKPDSLTPEMLTSTILKVLFRFSPSVHLLADGVIASPYEPYVSVHIRTGLDFGEAHIERFAYFFGVERELATTLLDCAVRSQVSAKPRIFVTSDSKGVKAIFMDEAKRRGISVFSTDFPVTHLSRAITERRNISYSQKCLSFLSVFADFLLLSNAHIVVMSGSGFARMAFHYGAAHNLWIAFANASATTCRPFSMTDFRPYGDILLNQSSSRWRAILYGKWWNQFQNGPETCLKNITLSSEGVLKVN